MTAVIHRPQPMSQSRCRLWNGSRGSPASIRSITVPPFSRDQPQRVAQYRVPSQRALGSLANAG